MMLDYKNVVAAAKKTKDENEKLRAALIRIAFECNDRGEAAPHTLMINTARDALGFDPL